MIFDIGANIGKQSLENINKTNKIIAIEASPNTYNYLINNCSYNSNIICLNYAVCDNNEKDIIFYDANAHTISTLNKEWLTDEKSRFNNYTNFNEIICKTITIDKLIEIYGEPELIKVDVEGGEYFCVKSLNKKINMLCFEWAAELNDITLQTLDHLHKLGFKEFFIQNGDDYQFRPIFFYDIDKTKEILNNLKPKIDWGMLWCK